MRYELLFGAAFVAGLMGAMSQQSVAPHTRTLHDTAPAAAMASAAKQVVIPIAAAAPLAAAQLAAASAEPTTAKAVAAEAKPVGQPPVKKLKKIAKKAKPGPEVAAAPPPESERHGFFYRLFHKTSDAERVATAEPQS